MAHNEEKDEWDQYWKSKSLKRNFIERIRLGYFSKVFGRLVGKYVKYGPVLEAACGSGSSIRHLPRNCLRVGCDFSINALGAARRNCRNLTQCDIKHLPFKNDSFEVIFNQGVMEHFNDEEIIDILLEFKRVARRVVIIVPSSTSVFRIYNPFEDLHSRFFSRNKLRSILKKVFPKVTTGYLPQTGFLSAVGVGDR